MWAFSWGLRFLRSRKHHTLYHTQKKRVFDPLFFSAHLRRKNYKI
jgi:hypothetical protein